MEMYMVGGAVRDEILGVPTKDIDFSVVLTGNEKAWHSMGGNNPFTVMERELKALGFEIFQSKPEYLTIRARFPRYSTRGSGFVMPQRYSGKTADFVLARKEGGYRDGRRPDIVEPGTLLDDLARRDFTMNAIAKDKDGTLIDPFGGVDDMAAGVIKCVGKPFDRIIKEDALRGLRAMRFAITKGFVIDESIEEVLKSWQFREALSRGSVSAERIREELEKMFAADTVYALVLINEYELIGALFNKFTGIRLMPTMKG